MHRLKNASSASRRTNLVAEELVEKSLAMVIGLAPSIGYDAAPAVAHEAVATGKTVGKWRGSSLRILRSNSKELWSRGA